MTTLELLNTLEDKEKRYAWFCWWDSLKTIGMDRSWLDELINLAYTKGKRDAMVDAKTIAQRILVNGDDPYEVLNSLLQD